MSVKLLIDKVCLYIPIQKKAQERWLCAYTLKGEKVLEFAIPHDPKRNDFDYFTPIPMHTYQGEELCFEGDFNTIFFENLTCGAYKKVRNGRRPHIHYTTDFGWINDPNGLVFDGENYHLYYQKNPVDVVWKNMSWGHAISKDLLHWESLETVLLPDRHGTVFSGCAIKNDRGLLDLPEDTLIYFYTAAGSATDWSKGKCFTQRLAYSIDKGNTLIKIDDIFIDTLTTYRRHIYNRDPKVFWHEESTAYIMVLWLDDTTFGLYRSTDLKVWEMSDSFSLPEAWECPDLVKLLDEEGQAYWVFFSADGFYYFGTFDGYQFESDGKKHFAYVSKLPYAAQSFFGTGTETIVIPWLRMENDGRDFTGAMGIPLTLSIMKKEELILVSKPIETFFKQLKRMEDITLLEEESEIALLGDTSFYIDLSFVSRNTHDTLEFFIGNTCISYHSLSGFLCLGKEKYSIRGGIQGFKVIVDDKILEIFSEDFTVHATIIREDLTQTFRGKAVDFDRIEVYSIG